MQDFFFKSYVSILGILVVFTGFSQTLSPNYYAMQSLSSGSYLGWTNGSGIGFGNTGTVDQLLFIPVNSKGNIIRISSEGRGSTDAIFLAAAPSNQSVFFAPYSDSAYPDSSLLWEIVGAPVFNNGSNKKMSYTLKSLLSASDTAYYLNSSSGNVNLLPITNSSPLTPSYINNPGAFWTCWMPGKKLYNDNSGLAYNDPPPMYEQSEAGVFDSLSFDYYPIQGLITVKGGSHQYIITGDANKIRFYKKPLNEGVTPHHYTIHAEGNSQFSGWTTYNGQFFVVEGNQLKKYYLNGITQNDPSAQISITITDSLIPFSAPVCDQDGNVYVLDEVGYIRAFDNSLEHKLATSSSAIPAQKPLDLYIDTSRDNPILAFFDSTQALEKYEYNISSTNFTSVGASSYTFNLKHKSILGYGNQRTIVPGPPSLWAPVTFTSPYDRSFVSTCSYQDTNFYFICYFDPLLHQTMAHFLMNGNSAEVSSMKGNLLALCDNGGSPICAMGNPLLIFNEKNNSCEVFVLGYPKGKAPKLYTFTLSLPSNSATRLIYEHHWMKNTSKPDLMAGRFMVNKTTKMNMLKNTVSGYIQRQQNLIEWIQEEAPNPNSSLKTAQQQLDAKTANFEKLLNVYFSKVAPFPTATHFPIEYYEVFKTIEEAGMNGF